MKRTPLRAYTPLKAKTPLSYKRKKKNKAISQRKYLSDCTMIPTKVKQSVWVRDNGQCLLCHGYRLEYTKGQAIYNPLPNAHLIARSHLGLGIEENIVTLCQLCHYDLDFNKSREERKKLMSILEDYMRSKYNNWDNINRVYRKCEVVK